MGHRKRPLISLGLIQLGKGFGWAYKRRGLYPGGLVSGIKNFLEMSYSSVDRNTFLKIY